jgi:multidrug efflux pump subunit AcrB
MALVSHYDIAPVIDIYGAVQGRDLGAVSADIDRVITARHHQLPRGSRVVVRGQVQSMRSSYIGLLTGLAFSIVLVYLLIVVNFQSWLDPFIIITALPAALAGIAWPGRWRRAKRAFGPRRDRWFIVRDDFDVVLRARRLQRVAWVPPS